MVELTTVMPDVGHKRLRHVSTRIEENLYRRMVRSAIADGRTIASWTRKLIADHFLIAGHDDDD